jgi:hypothetical protein
MADRVDQGTGVVRSTDERTADRPLAASMGLRRHSESGSEASPHSRKFRAVTGVLGGLAVGAIVLAVVILANHTHGGGSAPQWSSWQPPDGGNQGAREIADHIAPFYRISAADQLDVVTVLNLTNPNTVSASSASGTSNNGLEVAVRPDPSSSQVSLLNGNTIAYNLCGTGTTNCAIGQGTPSSDRLLLLRREALELALYSFKYLGSVDNVVAILPPGHTQATSRLTATPPSPASSKGSSTQTLDIAVLFVKGELTPWLRQPLAQTLAQFPPPEAQLPLWHQTEEAGLVDQITARGLFSEKLEAAQDGSHLIVLDPLPPQ